MLQSLGQAPYSLPDHQLTGTISMSAWRKLEIDGAQNAVQKSIWRLEISRSLPNLRRASGGTYQSVTNSMWERDLEDYLQKAHTIEILTQRSRRNCRLNLERRVFLLCE